MNPRLRALAYRMLGSIGEAEEVVQEAQLRLLQRKNAPDNEEAFLFRVTANLCVDRLRKEKVRRNAYFGPWLPEPSEDDDTVELAQDLSIGFLRLLEELTPAERVSYVLREGFDFSFKDIAGVLDISEASARQRASRARRRLKSLAPVPATNRDEQKVLLEALVDAVARRDTPALIELLSEGAVVYADGGGVVSATIRPVTGRERIAQVAMHLAGKTDGGPDFEYSYARLNGGWAMLIQQGASIHSLVFVDGAEGRIDNVYVVRNPDKLRHLRLS